MVDNDRPIDGRIGILVKRFPKLSETFVLGEILGLERAGFKLHLFSLYPPTDRVFHPATGSVRAPLFTLPRTNLSGLVSIAAAHVALLARHPLRYLNCLFFLLRREEGRRLREFTHAAVLARQLKAQRIRHLHTHFISEPVGVAELAGRLCGVPFSISAHAKDIYLSAPNVLRRKLEAARFTVTCTDYNRRFLQQLAGGPTQIFCMYHGLDLARFDVFGGGVASVPEKHPLILSIGRLREKKGFPVLIEACKALRELDLPFRCQIAGYGPDHAALNRMIDRFGLQDQVRLLGKLPHEAVLKLYRQAALFVLPCRVAEDGDRDGIPNVLLEAMAMRLPVVSTAVSGIPEVVEHQRNGLLVAPDDPAALADTLQQLLQEPLTRRRYGEAGRRLVEQRFSVDQNLARLTRLLHRALSHPQERIKGENAYVC